MDRAVLVGQRHRPTTILNHEGDHIALVTTSVVLGAECLCSGNSMDI
jgi:hypothetical protein